MGIIKLTNPVPPDFEGEVEAKQLSLEGAKFVRPCERYKEFLKSCRSIRGRMHQYYVYGELFDCSMHEDNYNACLDYRKSQDFTKLKKVIEWEKHMMETRIMAERQNVTWEFRTEPPADFESPLPEFLAKRQANSTFKENE